MEQVSIDEAFLDVTGALVRLGPAVKIAQDLRQRVHLELGVTCSAGIGRSKSVAKIASRRAKPDGLIEVPADQTREFLRPLPVEELWGIGPKTRQALHRLGLTSVAELADAPDSMVLHAVGEAAGRHLLALARGIDDSPVLALRPDKSIGAERTFEKDLPRGEELRREVIRLADKAAWRLREAGMMCRTVAVKVRGADFETYSRSLTLPNPTDQRVEITKTAHMLVNSVDVGAGLYRLVGVRLENLAPRAGQPLQLAFDQVDGPDRRVDDVLDQVRRRFGGDALGPGTLIP
jgi:DNA polymerase-4